MEYLKESKDELDENGDNGADHSTEDRIEKLESSVAILFGLFIGHLIGQVIFKLLQLFVS